MSSQQRLLDLPSSGQDNEGMSLGQSAHVARVALVGDRSPHIQAHSRIPMLLASLRDDEGLPLDTYWVRSPEVEGGIAEFDAIWLVPGSPYRDEAGAVEAVRIARENGIPFLGTCGGFQHAMLEFARNKCGLTSVGHAENDPQSEDPLIVRLACSLVGQGGVVHLERGSLAEHVVGAEETTGRYQCSYGLSPTHLGALRRQGMRFSGVDENGEICIAEIPDNPFFLATLLQPELSQHHERPHAIIRAFARAAVTHQHKRIRALPILPTGH